MSEERNWALEPWFESHVSGVSYAIPAVRHGTLFCGNHIEVARAIACVNALSAVAHPERLPELLRTLADDVRSEFFDAYDALGIDPQKLKETP